MTNLKYIQCHVFKVKKTRSLIILFGEKIFYHQTNDKFMLLIYTRLVAYLWCFVQKVSSMWQISPSRQPFVGFRQKRTSSVYMNMLISEPSFG